MSYESVQEMFGRVTAEFGPQTAIERAGRRVTYAKLEVESNRLANVLLAGGVGKGTMVAVLTHDPIQIITGILGVLKAGAVFVPLDTTFPEGRLRVMNDQVEPQWYVTETKHLELLQNLLTEANRAATIVPLDDSDYLSSAKPDHPRVATDPDAPCSIYFTSGSTGRPKAILGRLKGIDHFVRWEIEALGAQPGTRVSQLASPCFDGFLKDVFVPLCCGGTVCAPESREILADPARLVKWVDDNQLEILHCVPSVFRSLLNENLDQQHFAALRYVVMAGEPLYPADVKRWIETFGERIKLVNIYGTTETSVAKVAYEVRPEDVERPTVPVGKAIKGAAIMLMDAAGKPCRQGTVGEIYIRTPYRSFGYYGEPELTSQVFVQNPFSQDANDLVHKTGDYGRLLEDGNLEYLGRRDQQVQIRGVRIELGEIENLLRAHDAVADVAVVDRKDLEGNKFLVAYLTLTNGTGSDGLRAYLAERLPPSMLPSAFVELEQLPRTLNGKIDRKALPALELTQAKHDSEPGTLNPIEEIVAGIWCEVLRLPSVGRDADFFTLGGHSLLASQVVHRVQDIFKFELTVRSMFEAPTVAQLARVIQAKLNEGDPVAAARIEPVGREGKLPLSFAQQRLWFQEELAHGTSTFHVDLGMRLDGPLNWPALEQTFNEICRRHENLRTCFPVIEGELVQVVHRFAPLSLPAVDLTALSVTEREAIDAQLAAAVLAQPFDLETGPLVRLAILRHGNQKHSVICVLHHIVSDGWSRGILIREVSALYQAFSRGEPSALPELKVQYGDFAVWQRERLRDEALEREIDFWKEELAGAPPVLDLPTDRPRPPVQTYRGGVESFTFSADLSQRLKALSQKQGATMFMLLLAAYQTLLHRYTNEDDIVVGTTIANRERSEVEPLIGFFVNMLAVRAQCSGNQTFLEMLSQVRDTTLRTYAHQSTPFEKLVQELRPKRNAGYLPLFQAVFSFHNQPTLTEMELAGLTLTVPKREVNTTQIDLLLDMFEDAQGLQGAVQYNSDLFDRTTIVRLISHLQNLLQGISADPQQRLSDLPLLSAEETAQLTVFQQPGTTPHTCIHKLIEAQVNATPDAIAATFRGEQLTYAELNARANQVVHYLRLRNVKPGDLVGICLEHSFIELIAILGVLKSGAGYVALDPEHPPQRIAFALADANVAVVLNEETFATDAATITQQPTADLDVEVSADSLAYVIYTSGSTGEPKGAGISHRSLVNYVTWASDVYLRGDRLGFALYSSLAFDLTVTSIYVPLITGNTIAIYRRDAKDALLEEILADGQAGVCKLTPSHLSLIKDLNNRRSSVKRLIVGGEALGTELTRQVHESFGGDVEIYNEYGPTEATVGCMIYRFDAATDTRAHVAIGRPAANVNLYVLDEWLQPVPANVSGELFISSPGLARVYLGRPSLTAERFLPNPFATGERMYRTGDVCRRLPSGDFEYLGRQDEQVKFHGYRVELNEIRYALKKHPQIRDSAVVITYDKHGHKTMIGYYVSRQPLETSALRDFLSEHLIADTIPNFFVHLNKLPLTLNGKINYDALPSLEEAKEKQARSFTAARTQQEVSLAAIWSEVLSLERVGIDENFFDLGGHSLLAAQIIHRINQTFDIDLPMRVIFDEPTIAGLALSIEEALIEKLEAVS